MGYTVSETSVSETAFERTGTAADAVSNTSPEKTSSTSVVPPSLKSLKSRSRASELCWRSMTLLVGENVSVKTGGKTFQKTHTHKMSYKN